MLISQKQLSFHRELLIVKDSVQIKSIIQKYFLNNTLFASGYDPPLEAKIIEIRESKWMVIDFKNHKAKKDETYTLYIVLNRYAHVSGRIVTEGVSGGRYYLLEINHIAIAKLDRSSKRILVSEKEVTINNFRISKNELNVGMNHVPTSIKLGFNELKNRLKANADFIEINALELKDELDGGVFKEISKNGKPILVRNTADPNSYLPFNKSYFNYADYLKSNLRTHILECKKKGIISEIILPIIYISNDQTPIPLGYVHMQSKSVAYSPEDVQTIWIMLRDMLDRIAKANAQLIISREQVMDISRGGLMMKIKNPELIEKLKIQKFFTFDLFFNMEAPITLYGMICTFYTGIDGANIGVHIQGNSSRDGEMKRYYEKIDYFEKYHAIENQKKEKLLNAIPIGNKELLKKIKPTIKNI